MTTIESEKDKSKKRRLPRNERLRDWPVHVWSFACEIVGETPTWIGETKTLQRKLWNDMAFKLRHQLAPHKIAGDDSEEIVKAKQERRQAVIKQFKNTTFVRSFGQKYLGQITSDCYYAIVDRFLLAMKEWPSRRARAKTAKGYVSWETGMPSPKYDEDSFGLNLPVVFNAIAGAETTWVDLYNKGGNVSLYRLPEASPGSAHNLEFRLKTPQGQAKLKHLKLLAKIHRLPPPHAIVKRVVFICKSELGFKDRCKIQFSLEMPPLDLPRKKTGRVAGYDSGGWRVIGDHVRIGVLADNAGHFYEITIPFDFTGREDRISLSPKRKDIRRLDLLSEQIGDCIENCKRVLKTTYDKNKSEWPEEARQMMNGFTKMRQGGLTRLREQLEERDGEADKLLLILDKILDWLQHKKRALEIEWKEQKEATYKRIAAWIVQNLDRVAWEGDLSLKQMAETGQGDPSQRYRQLVGQYYLRARLPQAAAKYRCELIPRPVAYSTQVCSAPIDNGICGASIENTRKLLRVCEQGHKQDNDVNTSRLLLNEIEGAASISALPVEIPNNLQRYLRVMTVNETAIEVV